MCERIREGRIRYETVDPFAPFAFGGIHGQVGMPEKLVDGTARSRGGYGVPDAGTYRDRNAVDDDRRVECAEYPMRRRLCFLDGAFDEHRELVPTQPGDGRRFVQRGGQQAVDPNEKLVAGRMAQGVVDLLEVVQVEA